MSKQNSYQRQRVSGYILKVLQSLGGNASKQQIKDGIVEDEKINISYEDVYNPIKSAKTGNSYIPFNWDFNFGLQDLLALGYIEKYNRTTNIVLTEKGRKANSIGFPNNEEESIISVFWKQKSHISSKKQKNKDDDVDTESNIEEIKDDLLDIDTLRANLLDKIKKFSPKKFESFSRLLLSKMGIVFDKTKGVKMSNDHGIDGEGVFESDEFRTSKVVIQCKRYTDGHIGEPAIDSFRGVISKHSADYGVFITTTYFSENAKKAACQSHPTITLIDGQRLTDLIVKYGVGVKEVLIPSYSIDEYYDEKD